MGIVIGDVSGKGLRAAVQVAMAKYSLRSRAYEGDRPAAVLEQVNATLLRDMDIESFVTLFYGILNMSKSTLVYANAGHWPAMLWSASKRRAESLDSTGPLIGSLGGARYGEQTRQLSVGDELLLGTDGLFEVRCGTEFLGAEGLLELYAVHKRIGEESASDLVSRVLRFCGGQLRDDLAVLKVLVAK